MFGRHSSTTLRLETMIVAPPSEFHIVLPNAVGDAVLVLDNATRVTLPSHVAIREEPFPFIDKWDVDTGDLCAALTKVLHCNVYIRRKLWELENRDKSRGSWWVTVIVVDRLAQEGKLLLDDNQVPKNTRWSLITDQVEWERIHPMCNITIIMNDFLQEELMERRKRVSHLRPPWRLRGWMPSIMSYVTDVCKMNQLELVVSRRTRTGSTFLTGCEPILVQWQNCSHSTVLRCEVQHKGTELCEDADVFVKASIEGLEEGELTKTVAQLFPNLAPRLLNAETFRFVQIQDKQVENVPSSMVFTQALPDMHKNSSSYVELLLKCGIPDFTPHWIRLNLDSEKCLRNKALSCDEGDLLRSKRLQIAKICEVVEQCGFPDVLVHGDLDWSNVMECDESASIRFIDWRFCCISHPLVDYLRVTKYNWEVIEETTALKKYADVWLPEVSQPMFERAVSAIPPLVFLIHHLNCCRIHMFLEPLERQNHLEVIKKGLMRVVREIKNSDWL